MSETMRVRGARALHEHDQAEWDFDSPSYEYFRGVYEEQAQAVIDVVTEPLPDPSASTLGPFARDSGTSRRAALDAYPRQGSQRARVIGSLRMGGDATREELAIRLGLSENTIRPRVKELIEGGWVEETDHTRLTTRGSEAVLLALTFKAREELGRRLAEARAAACEEPGGLLGMVPCSARRR